MVYLCMHRSPINYAFLEVFRVICCWLKRISTTGAEATDGRFLTNTYLDLKLSSRYVEAGARLEYLKHPLPGYENDFKGWGVPYAYLKGRYKNAELTLGSFYEQFGSGFILRSYEERSLGIDNSLQGARLNYRPWAGVAVKVLTGRQRRYWSYNKSWMTGADVEWNIDELFKSLQQHNTYLMLGASYLNKHERDEVVMVDPTHRLRLPLNVNAFDMRLRVQHHSFNILAEVAMKTQDPSHDNGYIYRNGYVAMLSGSYSKRGMSLLLQASVVRIWAFAAVEEWRESPLSSIICPHLRWSIPILWQHFILMPHVLRVSGHIKQL